MDDEKKIFQCNMITRESLINALFEVEFINVKGLDLSYDVQTRLDRLYESDEHTKKTRLQNCKLS